MLEIKTEQTCGFRVFFAPGEEHADAMGMADQIVAIGMGWTFGIDGDDIGLCDWEI